MNAVCTVFERVESKYMMNREQAARVTDKMQAHVRRDPYFRYSLHNIYYDTEDSRMIVESMEHPDFREKLRLRYYGEPKLDQPVFLETKRKAGDLTYKRRISLSEASAYAYLDAGIRPRLDGQIEKELDAMVQFYHPSAKIYIAYDREAWEGLEEPDLRITFDTNLRYRTHDLSLSEGPGSSPLMDSEEFCLMEIKALDRYPMWLVRILSEEHLYCSSFSKYGCGYCKCFAAVNPSVYAEKAYRKARAPLARQERRGVLNV